MISVVMIVKNGARTLKEVLTSLSCFPEIILVDTGSSDKTVVIAENFPSVRIFEKTFTGFGELRNTAASFASYDWILALDADEVLSKELQDELLHLKLSADTLYHFPFHNYFNGKHIRTSGWHPESHPRLYHRKSTSFSDAKVHEKLIGEQLKKVYLKSPINHYPYHSISDFLVKMERYSTLFADQYVGIKRSSPLIALYHGLGAFLKCYLLKRGLFGGYEGFLISLYNGHTAFYKYLKLYHRNHEATRNSSLS